MTKDLDQLRQVAERATPGPWAVYDRDIGYEVHNANGYELNGGMRETFTEADATHIATFDPPTVLALIERVQAAERCFDEADSIKIEHEGAIQRVREEHPLRFYDKWMRDSAEPQGYGGWCASCGRFDGDSCPTIRALDGGEQE